MRARAAVIIVCLGIIIAFPAPSGAQWEQTMGPGGGTVYAFAVKGTKILAGTQAGIFISADQGSSWKASNAGLPAGYWVYCLGVSGPNVLAAGPSGLYFTSDEGLNWIRATAGLDADVDIKCFAEIDSTLFAFTQFQGVLLSRDHGLSWMPAGGQLPSRDRINSFVAVGSDLFAVMAIGGIYVSGDNGKSWAAAAAKWPIKGIVTSLVAIGGQLVAATTRGVFISSDNGGNWTPAQSGVRGNGYIKRLEVIGPAIFAGTSEGEVFMSRDNGRNWAASGSGLPANYTVNCIAACGTTICAGMEENPLHLENTNWPGGVYRSTDGGATWKASNSGLANAGASPLAAIGPYLFAGLSLSTDGGASWVPVSLRFPGLKWIGAHAEAGPYVFAVTDQGIIRFLDNGTRWERLRPGLPVKDDVHYLAARGSTLFTATDDRVFSTDDYGASWREVKIVLPKPRLMWIRDLAVAGEGLFALVEVGEETGQLYLAAKDGDKWKDFKAFRGAIDARCLGVSGQRLLAGGLGGIYAVTQEGIKAVTARPESAFEDCFLCFAMCGTTVVAAAGKRLLFSTDGGDTWADLPGGSLYSHIFSLEPGGKYLFAGTSSSGVWRLPLSQVPAGKK